MLQLPKGQGQPDPFEMFTTQSQHIFLPDTIYIVEIRLLIASDLVETMNRYVGSKAPY